MSKITASFKSGSNEVTGVPVVNPGDWFGKAWCLDYGCGPVIVEADSCQDAIDELVESDQGVGLRIEDSERGDYGFSCGKGDIIGGVEITEPCWMNLKGEQITDPVKGRQLTEPHTSGGGIDYDMDNLHIEGQDGAKCPFKCLYHGEGIPEGGLSPLDYSELQNYEDEIAGYIAGLKNVPEGMVGRFANCYEEAKRIGYDLGQTKAFEFVNKETGGNVHQVPQLLKELAEFCWSSEGSTVDLYQRCMGFVNNARALRDPRCHIEHPIIGGVQVTAFRWHNDGVNHEEYSLEKVAPSTRFTFERLLAEESK